MSITLSTSRSRFLANLPHCAPRRLGRSDRVALDDVVAAIAHILHQSQVVPVYCRETPRQFTHAGVEVFLGEHLVDDAKFEGALRVEMLAGQDDLLGARFADQLG